LEDLVLNDTTTLYTPDFDNEVEIETWSYSGDIVSIYVPFEQLEKWVASIQEQIITSSNEQAKDCAGIEACKHRHKPGCNKLCKFYTPVG